MVVNKNSQILWIEVGPWITTHWDQISFGIDMMQQRAPSVARDGGIFSSGLPEFAVSAFKGYPASSQFKSLKPFSTKILSIFDGMLVIIHPGVLTPSRTFCSNHFGLSNHPRCDQRHG